LEHIQEQKIYYRLVALWVFCEAFLGGIIHGLKIPISGIVVGSCAVFCISMLAYYVPSKTNIIKATIIVCIFKMMLSPYSPPTAYVAVFFQGLLGQFLIRKNKFAFTCLLFAIVCLVESALQRILIMIVIYGNDFWIVLNNFFNKLFQNRIQANYLKLVAIIYTAFHILVGIFIGLQIGKLPNKILTWKHNDVLLANTEIEIVSIKKESKHKNILLLTIWLIFILLLLFKYISPTIVFVEESIVLKILIRSVIIILSWKLFLSPFLQKKLQQWLKHKKTMWSADVEAIVALLPWAKTNIIYSWKAVKNIFIFSKIPYFFKQLMANVIYSK
jgi:hypothetical protein